MKCVLTGKKTVGGTVTLPKVRKSELEWLKFEQYFIIQKQKHLLNLYFDHMIFYGHKRALIKLKASIYKKVNQCYLNQTVILQNLLY